MMNLKPLGDRVIVKQDEAEETTAGGLILAHDAKEKPQTASSSRWARASSTRTATSFPFP